MVIGAQWFWYLVANDELDSRVALSSFSWVFHCSWMMYLLNRYSSHCHWQSVGTCLVMKKVATGKCSHDKAAFFATSAMMEVIDTKAERTRKWLLRADAHFSSRGRCQKLNF